MFRAQLDSILSTPNDDLLEKFEKYYRVKLPKSYIDFLKQFNGAIPINGEFVYDNYKCLIERFLCILDNDIRDNMKDISWSEIRIVITELDERLVDNEELIGMNIIPIAALFAGDYVCFDFRKNPLEPQICIWYHEESKEFSPITENIANSFTDFLDLFVE